MTEPTKPVDLDELERLEKTATTGPWPLPDTWEYDALGAITWTDYGGSVRFNSDDDPKLIIALRNAAPALIAELRALRALRVEVEPVLRAAYAKVNCGHCKVAIANILARHYDKKEPTK